jgi:DmsE family decaheme c-type cytochrome
MRNAGNFLRIVLAHGGATKSWSPRTGAVILPSRLVFPLAVASMTLGFSSIGTPADAQTLRPIAVHAAQAPQTGQPAAAAGQYVGESTCVTCHDQKYTGTAHALKSNERTPASEMGCESCHGPGKAHVDAGGDPSLIVNFKTMRPQQASTYCVTCHDRGTHALWTGSQHDQRNVGCISCHSVHDPKGDHQLKAASQMQLCATCHQNIVNKEQRYHHMPVREAALTCASCHNVHGTQNVRLLKYGTTIDESCTSCHAGKRGPYLWEHAPVANACVTCHDPHGTNNDRMLVAKEPFLCQRCHVTSRHPPTVYEGFLLNNSTNANKIFGRSCTVCHQQIHGSNAPSGQFFLR